MKKKLWITLIISTLILIISCLMFKPLFSNLNYGLDLKGGFEVLYNVESLTEDEDVTSDMLKATYKSIIKRIDTLGVSEPEITIEGEKIRVKLPGVKNEEEARERLSTPAVLSFRDTDDNLLMTASVLGSKGASLDMDHTTGKPVVALDIENNEEFYSVTKKISESDDQTIVIWLDFNEKTDSFESQNGECGANGNMSCISAASVKEAFMNNVVIQGNFSQEEAQELVDLINSGSLPTKLIELSTKSVDASFGSEVLEKCVIAGVIALLLISLLLIAKYRLSGFVSSICLVLYSLSVFIVFILINGVLTLPGIAALILGIGMAVDCSIITIERVKDGIKNKSSLSVAYKEGNKSSLIAIIDANVTTMLAAVILFAFGESSVKGFATMLIISIVLTILIMVFLNRFAVKKLIDTEYFDKRSISLLGKVKETTKLNFLKSSKFFMITSGVVLACGIVFFFINSFNFGIDFTGGTDITISSESKINIEEINKIFEGYNVVDVNTSKENEVYVNISNSLEKEDINSIKAELKDYKVEINVISNIVKKELTKNAIISLILSCIGIVLYVAIRFNMNFGVTGILMLLHDVLIVISAFAISHIEINFIFIAALLTIIGYSINDTIVVFDRIRDNKKNLFKNGVKTTDDLKKVIEVSSNETLGRNIFTTISTIIAITILICMGINSLLTFNVAILIGLIAGAISSLFIAPSVLYLFEKRSLNKPVKKDDDDDEPQERRIKGINY